ncbi:MAG: alpha-N-arabinofuranosidase [Halanaerobiaceae bacterium]
MNKLVLKPENKKGKINADIYGHFAEHLGRCIYGGFWVGEKSSISGTGGIRDDVVDALQKLEIPVMRWPGGCFADAYHWRDGIGPREVRPQTINTHWGDVVENNHFGTHEFFRLCNRLGAEAYIAGNVGSGTVKEMADWLEYITCDKDSAMSRLRRNNGQDKPWNLKYFGIGNENWGCGGNMRPEHYADLFRRYQTYVRDYGEGNIYKIACGANGDDYRWTEVLMEKAADYIDGLSLHYYTISGSWEDKDPATGFGKDKWVESLNKTLFMEELIKEHGAIMEKYDPEKKVGLIVDEWGSWYQVEEGTNPAFLYQQNTLRDALIAGINLNIFNRHCERVQMANIAQTVNVLQSMILTRGEKIILTPTYYVFEMYKVHQEAALIDVELECTKYESGGDSIPVLDVSASRNKEGEINITICNLNPDSCETIRIYFGDGNENYSKITGRILTAESPDAHNTFSFPDRVTTGDFKSFKLTARGLQTTIPDKSVVLLSLSEY